MYAVQLNSYAIIAERIRWVPVTRLGADLLRTSKPLWSPDIDSVVLNDGFAMRFNRQSSSRHIGAGKHSTAIAKVREILTCRQRPLSERAAKDCVLLDIL